MKFNLKNERTKMYIVLILIVLIGKFYIKPKIENFQDSSTDKSLPKIYVINLKKDVTRLNNIKKQFKSKNLEFERIDGIDGRIISRDELKKYTTWFCGNFCSKEIIGCF